MWTCRLGQGHRDGHLAATGFRDVTLPSTACSSSTDRSASSVQEGMRRLPASLSEP